MLATKRYFVMIGMRFSSLPDWWVRRQGCTPHPTPAQPVPQSQAGGLYTSAGAHPSLFSPFSFGAPQISHAAVIAPHVDTRAKYRDRIFGSSSFLILLAKSFLQWQHARKPVC